MDRSLRFLLLVVAVVAGSCNSTRNTADSGRRHDKHNSNNSIDWSGTFRGIIPCADCVGIRTELILSDDLGYQLRTYYIGKPGRVNLDTGSFKWNEQGNTITLDESGKQFEVGENSVTILDQQGNKFTGQFHELYVLKKHTPDNKIERKYWKLIELKGQPVTGKQGNQKEAYLFLDPSNNSFSGNGSCNIYNGTYSISEGNRINFSQTISSMMACTGNQYESEYFKTLEMIDNFTIYNDTLSLNKAKMAPLARFVYVYINDLNL